MDKKQVRIRDLNADQIHDFPYTLGEEIVVDKDGNTGVVEDAIWEGNSDAPSTHYTVTYHLKVKNGSTRELGLNDLLPLNPK
jgi:hypothetical protein